MEQKPFGFSIVIPSIGETGEMTGTDGDARLLSTFQRAGWKGKRAMRTGIALKLAGFPWGHPHFFPAPEWAEIIFPMIWGSRSVHPPDLGSSKMVSWKSVSNWLTILILGMVCLPEAQPFSPETCRSICHVSSMICWFCESLHGSAQRDDLSTEYNDADYDFEDTEIVTQRRNRWLKAPSANELLKRGMISQKRQQKIVGGTTVRHGEEAPWTVG